MDAFGFKVGAHSAARRAVLWLRMAKMALFGAKNAVFRPKIHYLETPSKIVVTIMTGHQKDNIFVLTALHSGPLGGRRGPFLAQKSTFFYATPIKPPIFGLRRIRLNGIITSPYPEVTFDTFGFPVRGRLAARRAVFWR